MKILFHDVDGCLNAADGAPLANTHISLSRAQSDGMAELGRVVDDSPMDMLVLNTGRSIAATLPMAGAIGSAKLRYILGEHGATCFDLHKQSAVDLPKLVKGSGSRELSEVYATLGSILELMEWYHNSGHNFLERRIGQTARILPKDANLTFVTPGNVAQADMFAAIRQVFEENSPFDAADFVFHDSGSDGFVDVMSRIDKGHGVRLIGGLNGTAYSYGVGNGLNDLPMMRAVDMPVCPANSESEVLQYCRSRSGHVSEYAYVQATIAWLRGL